MESLRKITVEENGSAFLRLFNHVLQRRIIMLSLNLLVVLLISACTTIDTRSFDAFNAVADDIITIDSVIKPHIETVKNREMGEISRDLKEVNNLSLEFDNDNPFDYQYKFTHQNDEPLFLKLTRFDNGLVELNSAFEKYAYLLATLAGDELISEDEFRQLESDLNENLRNAAISLKQDAKPSGLTLFATIASAAAFDAIRTERKEMLIQIIDDNQFAIDAVIQYAQDAIRITRDEIIADYEHTRNILLDAYRTVDMHEHRLIADQFLAVSEETVAVLEMLKALNNTYNVLAFSHRQLSIGLKANRLPTFGGLKDAIENVWKRYRDMRAVNEGLSRVEVLVPVSAF